MTRAQIPPFIDGKYISVQKHPTEDLYLFNYTEKAQYEHNWTDETRQCRGLIMDGQDHMVSRPFPKFHNLELVPSAAGTASWRAAGATFGKVPTKKQTIFGYKLHLLVTLGGVIRDFILAPASASDVAVGAELLREQADLAVVGDKGYSSAPLAAELRAACGVALPTVPRRNQRQQLPAAVPRLRNGARQIVETVNDQRTEQFGFARHHAHTFPGLCARLHTKLAAHTLCLYRNRLLGYDDWLQIKALAFPN